MSDLSELLAPTNNPGLPRVEDFGRTLRRATLGLVFALGLPAVGLLCVVLILFRSVSELEQSERIIASARAIEELSVDAETALRGYQLTGDPVFLTGFNEARAAVPAHLDSLSGEVFGNAEKSGAVAALQRDLAALLTYSNEALARPRDGSETAAETAFNLRGRRLMENLRARLDKIVVREEVPRRQWLRLRDRLRVVLFVAAALLSLVGLPMTVIWVRRLLREMSISYGASVTAAEQRATELQVALRSIGDAVIATNLAGEVAFVNPVAEELTGWTNADARGRPLEEVFDIFNEQTGEPAENPAVRVLREGKVVGLANHTVLRARGGRETPIEDSAAPLLDDAGTIHGVVLVFRGVGEKRGFERRLFEAEWRSRTALEVGGAGSWVYEPAGDRMIGDAMLARTFGVPLERCTAGEPLSTFLARISADDRPRVRAALQEAAASGETFEIDWHLVHEDGSQRWVHARGRGEPAIAGEPHRILGFLHDITEEREIEDALRESEGRFRLLHELGDATRSLTDPHQIMESVARLLGAHLQASRCAYADVEKDSDHFAIQHDYTDGCASIVGTYQLALFGPRAEKSELIGADDRCTAVGVVVLDGEVVAVLLHIGIGAARRLKVRAQQPCDAFHNLMWVGEGACRIAELMEQPKTALAFTQRVLNLALLRDVVEKAENAMRFPRDRRLATAPRVHPALRAILMDEVPVDLEGFAARRRLLQRCAHARAIVGADPREERAQRLACSAALQGNAKRSGKHRISDHPIARGLIHPGASATHLERGPRAPFRLEKTPFEAALLADSAEDEDHAVNRPRIVEQRRRTVFDGRFAPAPRAQHRMVRESDHFPLAQHTDRRILCRLAGLLVEDVEHFLEGPAARVGVRPPGQLLSHGVHEGYFPSEIGGDHGIANRTQRDL